MKIDVKIDSSIFTRFIMVKRLIQDTVYSNNNNVLINVTYLDTALVKIQTNWIEYNDNHVNCNYDFDKNCRYISVSDMDM